MQNQTPSDAELLRLYKESGDVAHAGQLYARYTSMVYGVCLKYLKDRDEAKDGVMQLFEKLVTTLRTHDVENFKSWLYVTARNQCLMQLRARKGRFTEEISPQLMENQFLLHLEEEPEMEGNLSKLEKCIEGLMDEQQQCVRHFFLEEKCYKEVAELTGFDMNQVKSYIQNGKRNLKNCMEQNG
ncbi:MAG: sigma-70 family RNA polymerase sigma factor [Cyclobacteriaceae bacterium]|nr:sigma-70 family RNA polymerase sigma factor [Cyclobacteriaceae bacterium]